MAGRILALCEARGLTPIELVRTAGRDDSQARGESGRGFFERDFPLSALHRIARALGVQVGDLFETSRKGEPPEVKESPGYKQHRIHTLQLSSSLWIVSIVSIGTRKLTSKDSLTMAVTRIPREYDSEERAVQAAKDYIDQQAEQEHET